ncbi:glycosyltransferase, partial [Methanophagales archaeon]
MTKILALVYHRKNSRMAIYLEHLFKEVRKEYEVKMVYADKNLLKDTISFVYYLLRFNPDLIYATPVSLPILIISIINRFILRRKSIVHHDDLLYLFHKDFSDHNQLYLWLMKFIEDRSLRCADYILVFNKYQKKLLESWGYKNTYIVSHGADLELMKPIDIKDLREDLGIEGSLTIGIVAYFGYAKKYDIVYGWDIVEALRYLKDIPVKAILIGEGEGLLRLKQKAKEYGVVDNVLFMGRVDYHELPRYYNLLDICLLTQPDHPAARIRITLKFPEYLACGRFIITSSVGTPARIV